jgi:hyperosmotically inducible protein
MTSKMSRSRAAILAAMLAGSLLSLPQVSLAMAGNSGTNATGGQDQPDLTSAVKSKLNKSQFKSVQVNLDSNGIAMLTGSVELFEYKADAEKRVSKAKGVTAVRNEIEVAGPSVSDQELQNKLGEKLAYDRVGYGTTPFNAITIKVENGVVTLGGHAYGYPDRDSALALVSTYPGVKDVANEVRGRPGVRAWIGQTRMASGPRGLRLSLAEQVRHRPGQAHPHLGAERATWSSMALVDTQADKDTAYICAPTASPASSA